MLVAGLSPSQDQVRDKLAGLSSGLVPRLLPNPRCSQGTMPWSLSRCHRLCLLWGHFAPVAAGWVCA